MNKCLLLVGTKKGLFLLVSPDRSRWELTGPFHAGREINHTIYDRRTGLIFAAVNDAWFGCEISRSPDFGRSWQTAQQNPAFQANSDYQLERIWHIEPGRSSEPNVLYAGVAPAALFQSVDGGETWSEVSSLTNHPSRSRWQPGAGGLCLHSIVIDPANQNRMFVGISCRRGFPERGQRGDVATCQQGNTSRISSGQVSRIRPVRPQTPSRRRGRFASLSAESLRSLPDQECWRRLGGNHVRVTLRFWFSAGGSSPTARNALCNPAARRGISVPVRRKVVRLSQSRWRSSLGASGQRSAAKGCLRRSISRGHGDRLAGSGGSIFRDEHRKAVWIERSRRLMARDRG